jgi:hypothetical protein
MENSEILKQILEELIDISSRKTTEAHAVTVMGSLMEKLRKRYNFLEHVDVKDTRFLEDVDSVSVMSEIDKIPPNEIGKAIYSIIYLMNKSLGKDAGHFFIKELSRNIGDNYNTSIKNMGVDLSLMQLESQVTRMERRFLDNLE